MIVSYCFERELKWDMMQRWTRAEEHLQNVATLQRIHLGRLIKKKDTHHIDALPNRMDKVSLCNRFETIHVANWFLMSSMNYTFSDIASTAYP